MMKLRHLTGCVWLVMAAMGCAAQTSQVRPETMPALQTDQLLAVAELSERMGDKLRAQQYYSAAYRTGAAPERVLPALLRLYIADGQYRLAIDTLQDHLRSHPQQHGLRLLLANLYAATQLTAAALAEYERVLSAWPNSAAAHFALASLLHDMGAQRGRADEHFRAYLAYAPSGAHAEEARSLLLETVP